MNTSLPTLATSWACLWGIERYLSAAKLVIYKKGLCIPCLTCDPIISLQLETISLQAISKTWDAVNINMHKYLAYMEGSVNATCNINHKGFSNLFSSTLCPVAEISKKYNLTLVQAAPNINLVSSRNFNRVIYSKKIYLVEATDYIYEVGFISINFITVTNPATHANGVDTFVTPFDKETWNCILITVFSAAAVLTWLGWRGGKTNVVTVFVALTDKLIAVTFVILGQVGDTGGRPYCTVKATIILFNLWLFGYLVLQANVYQGSIYSCLTVLKPPLVPSGVEDLINWKIPIVAEDYTENFSGDGEESYLLDHIIPQLILSGGKGTRFTTFLIELQAKLLSGNNISVTHMMNKILVENSSQSHPTIVIMMPERQQEHFQDPLILLVIEKLQETRVTLHLVL